MKYCGEPGWPNDEVVPSRSLRDRDLFRVGLTAV